MEILKELKKDSSSAILKIKIDEKDYADKVEKALSAAKKNIKLPGFRPGMIPKDLIKKQYGISILADEINKLIASSLDKYISEEKLAIFGQPMPLPSKVNWETDKNFEFEFEVGLIPEISVDLKPAAKNITNYNIKVSDNYIDEHIESLTKRFGKITPLEKTAPDSEVNLKVMAKNADGELYQPGAYPSSNLNLADVKNTKKMLDKSVNDEVELSVKDFKDKNKLSQFLGKSIAECEDFKDNIIVTINAISNIEKHALNTEFFDKIYGEGTIKDEADFKNKIRSEAEEAFKTESDSHLMNSTIDFLIENIKVDLPEEFLIKWFMLSGEKPMSENEAKQEFEKSKNAIKYQLIEASILKQNDIKVSLENIIDKTKELIKAQMAQFGQANMTDENLKPIIDSVLKNNDEVNRIQSMIVREKLLSLFKEQIPYKQKDVSLDEFIKEVTKKK